MWPLFFIGLLLVALFYASGMGKTVENVNAVYATDPTHIQAVADFKDDGKWTGN